MSYCRFSTNDFTCDVYCYESCDGGWDIHVAAVRHRLKKLPPPIPFDLANLDAWFERHKKVMKMVRRAKRYPIGLPCDGQSYNEPTAATAGRRLIELKCIGYNVPQEAIDALIEESLGNRSSEGE
jgi:hypothetical protein